MRHALLTIAQRPVDVYELPGGSFTSDLDEARRAVSAVATGASADGLPGAREAFRAYGATL